MASEEIPRNFSYLVEGELAGSAHPAFGATSGRELIESLRARGVGAVVSLDEQGLDPRLLREGGIEHLLIAIPDFHAPSMEQIEEFVSFAREHIAGGRPVLAHCKAGMGRTGTMLACYLVAQGADPRDAINKVRKARPGSIETYGQEDSIYAYFRRVQRLKAAATEADIKTKAKEAAPPREERLDP